MCSRKHTQAHESVHLWRDAFAAHVATHMSIPLRRLPRLCMQNWAELRKALASSTAQPIRIKWVFEFNQGWLTPKQKAALQDSYIPETTAIFQHFIKVRGGRVGAKKLHNIHLAQPDCQLTHVFVFAVLRFKQALKARRCQEAC